MPSAGYIATRKHTGETGTGPFAGPAVDYINSATDIEVEKIASGTEPNTGVILTVTTGTPGATEYTIDSSVSPPTVTLGVALVSGDVLKVRRKTTRGSREVDFVQGSTLTEADLDKATKQGIYLGEEALDRATDANDLYDDMTASYTSGTMPGTTTANDFLVSNGSVFSANSAVDSRAALSLGTAALVDTGTTATSTIPLNTSSAALGTAAYKATGTSVGDVPLNVSPGGVLGNAAYKNVTGVSPATGEIPLLVATNALPAVSGVNLTNLAQPPRITIQHAYLMTSSGEDARGSSSYMTGSLTKDQWHVRPLDGTIIVHPINGEAEGFGVVVTAADNTTWVEGGVGAEINFSEEGTYSVEIHSTFYRPNDCTSRFVDLDDTVAADSVIIQGTTARSFQEEYTTISSGSGVFVIGADDSGSGVGKIRGLKTAAGGAVASEGADCRRFSLQFAMSQTRNVDVSGNGNILGKSMLNEIAPLGGGSPVAYLKNVFAWVHIVKLAQEQEGKGQMTL